MLFSILIEPSFGMKSNWDQAAVDKALASFYAASDDRDIQFERLWLLVQDEIMRILKMELRSDIAVDEAGYMALEEFRHRLESGVIKFLKRAYLRRYICSTAVRIIRKRQHIHIDFTSGNAPPNEPIDFSSNPSEKANFRFADLYFCLEKLSPRDKQLLHLHHFEDKNLEDIAKVLNMQHDAVRKAHSRALKKLRICLEGLNSGGWF